MPGSPSVGDTERLSLSAWYLTSRVRSVPEGALQRGVAKTLRLGDGEDKRCFWEGG